MLTELKSNVLSTLNEVEVEVGRIKGEIDGLEVGPDPGAESIDIIEEESVAIGTLIDSLKALQQEMIDILP